MKDKYVVVNIRQSLELEKEEKVKKIIQEFSCPQNKEVETFLKMIINRRILNILLLKGHYITEQEKLVHSLEF